MADEQELRATITRLSNDIVAQQERERKLAGELALMKAAFPTCEKHKPAGGTRSGCMLCGLTAQNYALSQIDYLCGEPNDMEVSGFDVHCDEQAVVEHVRTTLVTLKEDARGLTAIIRRAKELGFAGEQADTELAVERVVEALNMLHQTRGHA